MSWGIRRAGTGRRGQQELELQGASGWGRAIQLAAALCPGPVGTAVGGVPASDSPVVSQVAVGGKASLELAGSAPARVPGF